MLNSRKKITALFVAVIISISCLFCYGFATSITGDLDGDGKVSAGDARLALRHSVGLENLSTSQKKVADLNGDGNVTAADARLILRLSVGLSDNTDTTEESTTKKSEESTTKKTEESTTKKTEESTTKKSEESTKGPTCGADLDSGKYTYAQIKAYLEKKAASETCAYCKQSCTKCPSFVKTTCYDAVDTSDKGVTTLYYTAYCQDNLDNCPSYTGKVKEQAEYWETHCDKCGKEIGYNAGQCMTYSFDCYCPKCGKFMKADSCHHCTLSGEPWVVINYDIDTGKKLN